MNPIIAVFFKTNDLRGRIFVAGKDGDLVKYFEDARDNQNLPTIEELHSKAITLFSQYGHPHAFERAVNNSYRHEETKVPEGKEWLPPSAEDSSANLSKNAKKKCTKQPAKKSSPEDDGSDKDEPEPFQGDQSLAQSC